MGYIYAQDSKGRFNKLVCDKCGQAGARKYRCPFEYCQPIALCPTCRKMHPELVSRKTHRDAGCEKLHIEFTTKMDKEKDMREHGIYIRCSAMGVNDGLVHVLFKNKDHIIGYYMDTETYHAIPLGEIAMPSDYLKHGPMYDAPSDYVWGDNKPTVSRSVLVALQCVKDASLGPNPVNFSLGYKPRPASSNA